MITVREQSVNQLQAMLRGGETTSVALVESYLARIEQLESAPYHLNAISDLNPNALDEAFAADKARLANHVKPSQLLFGLPVLIKDNIDVKGMPTTAGSLALSDNIAENDAVIVQRLRAAGAIILGKTNLSEFAHFMSDTQPSGFSSRGGRVINPIMPDITPSGSSSGSAVAVATSMTTVTVGTETNGSILAPAHMNSIVGLKPTHGLLPNDGILPLAESQDTAGPMGRTVADTFALFAALNQYNQNQKLVPVMKPHLSVLSSLKWTTPLHEAISDYVDHYDLVDLPEEQPKDADEMAVLLSEFRHGINTYLAKHSTRMNSLQDIVKFNRADPKKRAPFGQDLLEKALLADEASQEKQRIQRISRHLLDDMLKDNNVLLGDDTKLINLAAIAGYPSLTVPTGSSDDLYFHGLSSVIMVAKPFNEIALKVIGESIESHHQRLIPEF
ncbi:amidase [Leuconostoc falkenbergense]|uniref:amidase family protein n=1 Tax=Leuconostoc falkenbergense TaxID=2766470 RepID=UPI001662B732|nr:amidase family protein [Leuconostoc falkenbergense]MCT4404640.1 amidase [Leuconostoc falkenbergense]